MKGAECRLIEFMEGSKKRFIIPVYQRNYDWKEEQCKKLFDDLVKLIKNDRRSHFFGSLVSVYEPSGRNTEFLVIDGQQRLTTLSLLFLAMYHLLKEEVLIAKEASLENQIWEDFLVDKYQPEETRMKLKLIKNDREAFGKLFKSKDEFNRVSNITINYKYFYERIKKEELTIDELYEAICRLEIINITLSHEDNPQLIFESLNSTGLDLSEGDKIRNFILMGLSTEKQEKYYGDYWNLIEEYTNYDVSAFVRDYLSMKIQEIPPQNRVYQSFKDYVEMKRLEVEALLTNLLSYAKRYHVLLVGETKSKVLNACIYRLNRLETTVTRPFFLEVLRLFDEEKIGISEVEELFLITENYLFRRNICNIATNSLNKIFLFLHREIIRYEGDEKKYLEKFKYALISKKNKARFPEDEEFVKEFSARPVYQMNRKNKIYILERFENEGTLEDKDIYRHCEDGTFSVEHIMPQTLNTEWKKELGENYEKIHDSWCHRIANLTLTAYNSKYSNSSFKEKKTMDNGLAASGIRMNFFIANQEKWTLKELEERNELLMKKAIEIWSFPKTEFVPRKKEMEVCTLEDADNLTGRRLSSFCFRNAEEEVSSWADMYGRVLNLLFKENRCFFMKLADESEDIALYFSFKKEDFANFVFLGSEVYASTNTSTQTKIYLLEKIFKGLDVELNDLIFYLREEK